MDIFQEVKSNIDIVEEYKSQTGNRVKRSGDEIQGKCFLPGHEDKNPSMSINKNKGTYYCHACSEGGTIIDMTMILQNISKPAEAAKWLARKYNIPIDENPKRGKKMKEVKRYDYRDKEGDLAYQVVRFEPKSFRQVRPDGSWGLGDTQRILYHLPEVLAAAKNNELVFLVEGEKDVDNLRKLDLTATTSPMGAGKWQSNYTKSLKGAKVIILPDNDDPGKKHAFKVNKTLNKNGIESSILELPDLEHKQDVSDWLNMGFDKDDLLQRVKELELKEWEEPIPINNIEVQELPVNILPDWLSNYINNLSDFLQAPSDMVLLIALSALSTALANKVEIEIKTGYKEPIHIWTCSVLPPANRKSPIVKKLSKPVWDYESQIREEIKPERRHMLQEKEILENVIEQKKKVASKQEDASKRDNTISRINELGDDLDLLEEEIPALPRLLVDDITAEKLAQIMEENQGRAAVLSAEGDIFQNMLGKYSRSTNFSTYKKAWTGSERIVDDRIGRQGTSVENPSLSIGICSQPVVIEELQDKKSFRGEGLISRFLWAIPDSPVGRRLTGDEVPELNKKLEIQYINNMHKLLRTEPAEKDGQSWKPHKLRLSAEALQVRNKFESDIEDMLAPGGKLHHAADWGGKIVGNMIRVAGLIEMSKKVKNQYIWSDLKISADSMEGAVKLGHNLINHALKTFELLEVDPEIELAKYVLERIKKGIELQKSGELPKDKDKLDRSALMELCRGKKEIKRPDDLKEVLKLLEELNYIKLIERSGRRTPIIKLNPYVHQINQISKITEKYNSKSDKSDKSDTVTDSEFDNLREVII